MIRLAWKNSLLRPGRVFLMVFSVAVVLAEILVLEGFLAGSYTQLRRAVLRRGGDVIVAQKGVANFLATRSILPQRTRAAVEALPGVASTYPLAALGVIYEQGERRSPIIILVYDDAGGPAEIVAGRAPDGEREVAIDLSLAARYGLVPGDTLTLSDFDFTIAGISRGSAALFTPFAFVTFDNLIDFYFESDVADDIAAFPLLSFLAVETAPGIDPAELAARISEKIDGADAILPHDLARNDENMGRELLGPILNLLLGLSYGIDAMAIGMFMFASVRSRRKSLGVLRALGFRPRDLVTSVVAEALATALMAIPLGILIAAGLAALIQWMAPVYLLHVMETQALLRTAAIALLLAVLGALAPLRMLLRLDPATAFRE
jgi:putative ABC transport system permease protein